jgi:uncharacterized membrane protein
MIAARPLPEAPSPAAGSQPQRRGRSFKRRRRLLFGALAIWAAALALAAFVLVAARMFLTGDRALGLVALGLLGGFVMLRGLAWYCAQDLRCQLCHGAVLRDKGCRKHRDATKLPLLSYRLSAALMVLTRHTFHCMYCGTAFRLRKSGD